MHLVGIFLDQAAGQRVLLVDDAADLLVDLAHGLFGNVGRLGDGTSQEDLALVLGVDHGAQPIAHAVARDHVARQMGGPLEVVGSAGGHLVHEHLFGNAATKEHGDLAEHVDPVVAVAITLGQRHGDAQRTATRDDGDLVDRIGLGQQAAQDGVAGLVVGRAAALVLGHDHGAALRTHQDLVLGTLEVDHLDQTAIATGGKERCLVDQVGQIGAGHAGSATGQHVSLHIGTHRHLAHVDVEDLLATTDVGQRHHHLAVKAARTQQRGIQHVRTVGGRDEDDALAGLEAVHLDQQLVQRLLALVVATAQASAPLTAHRVDLVDEDDAGGVLLGVLEHVADAGCTHTDEHLDEIGTRDGEERHLGFTGDGTRQQRLAGPRRTDHQDATRNAATQLLEAGGITQEVDHFLDFFLGLVGARHIGKGDGGVVLIQHARAALAEREGPAPATALHLAHEEDPDADEQQHGEPRDEDLHQDRLLFLGLGIDLNAVLHQVADHPDVAGGRDIRGQGAAVAGAHANGATIDLHAVDLAVLGLFHELGIRNVPDTPLPCLELSEHGKQDQGDDHPDGCFGKRVIHLLFLIGHADQAPAAG